MDIELGYTDLLLVIEALSIAEKTSTNADIKAAYDEVLEKFQKLKRELK